MRAEIYAEMNAEIRTVITRGDAVHGEVRTEIAPRSHRDRTDTGSMGPRVRAA